MKLYSLIIILILSVSSCGFNKPGSQSVSGTAESEQINNNTDLHMVTLSEIIKTSSYSYVKLKEGDKEYWAALPSFDGKIGQTYYYDKGMEMKDFKSKELNRTFSSLWFIEGLSEQPIASKNQHPLTPAGRQRVDRVPDLSVKPAENGITISKLMSEKSQYANKKVIIRGKVMKFSPEIMNKNWVHIQDGTEASGEYDLVVTTSETVNVGDVVTFEGVIATDKDFGYGYKYDVIMEDAKISKQ